MDKQRRCLLKALFLGVVMVLGTGAKMAYLFAHKKLKLKEQYVNKSAFGTQFTGQLIETALVGQYAGVVGEITGSAYITGFHQFIRDEFDK